MLAPALLAALAVAADPVPNPFVFKDGDRVVFLGGTLVEREQKYGYWELALTGLNKDKAGVVSQPRLERGHRLVREPRQLRRAEKGVREHHRAC